MTHHTTYAHQVLGGLLLISLPALTQPTMTDRSPGRHQQRVSQPDSAAGDTAYSALVISLDGSSRSFYLAREFGNKALSLEPEITYSHKSGVYATISGFYLNQGTAPRYAFTDVAIGYEGEVTPRWNYSAALDRLYFTPAQRNNAEAAPIRNGFEAYTNYRLGPITLGANYNYFFGGKTAHVLTTTLGALFKKEHWRGVDTITLEPYWDVFFGTNYALLRYGGLYQGINQLLLTRQGRKLLTGQGDKLRLMGSEIVVPVALSIRAFTVTLAGHTVLPVHLSDETTALPTVFYGQLSVGYTLR